MHLVSNHLDLDSSCKIVNILAGEICLYHITQKMVLMVVIYQVLSAEGFGITITLEKAVDCENANENLFVIPQ